ncbi:uncharacterized protein LOC125194973 [Salvia hispanica]|uniref:uncharacterized protein LOC125194973 n=1 Tax=Salvia hispanica TaxID=49212 RepID=UPI002009A8BE|nr:uncharacterized protein LOC125194973 [Salvia hispanica]
MSEKMKKEEEEVLLDHFLHEHPLSLTETRVESICNCCRRRFYGELGYTCSKKCGSDVALHEDCAEMLRNITHPAHPHALSQKKLAGNCAVCETNMRWEVGYHCLDAACDFQLHLRCASSMGVVADLDSHSTAHPSHPQHQLRFWRRPGRSCYFKYDACGTREMGSSYACIACQYWIHESCAALPVSEWFPHHKHSLSLDFHFPIEYVVFNFKCDICRKPLLRKHWVYHCRLCRYVVHIKCAINASSNPNTLDNDEDATEDEEDVLQFPINDTADELIRSFVKRVGETEDDNEITNGQYKFHSHDHHFSLISPSSSHNNDEENSDDDEDDFTYGEKSQLACDGCTAPIHPHKSKYYTCVEGKYFLHSPCFRLPRTFTPPHPRHTTPLTLQTCPKFDTIKCSICQFYTNGLFYSCAECDFKADVKCASLPPVIKHRAHSQPRHRLKLVESKDYKDSLHIRCIGCSDFLVRPGNIFYSCQKCEFVLCCMCVLLPASDDTRCLDQHVLPLAFNAAVDHPGKFYCDECETEMNPKRWMFTAATVIRPTIRVWHSYLVGIL